MRGRIWLNFLCFGLSVSAVLIALHSPKLFPEFNQLHASSAFRYFCQTKDGYQVVFLGSSYTADQVDPAVFDARCAERGYSIRSVNLAAPGSLFYRIDDELRRVLAESPRQLQYVVMDPRPAHGFFREEDRGTSAAVRWHTPLQTLRALRRLHRERMPLREKPGAALAHLTHLARNLFCVSRGLWDGDAEGLMRDSPGRRFLYEESGGDRDEEQREAFMAMLEAYPRFDPELSLGKFDLAALDSQIRLLQDRGIQPVFVATPSLKVENVGLKRLAQTRRVPIALFLDDPEIYPSMFELRNRNRHDSRHLARTPSGAGAYSRLLADRFVDEVLNSSSAPLSGPAGFNAVDESKEVEIAG